MKITEIKYVLRKNLGNYEHSELTASAIVSDTEDANSCLLELISFVEKGINKEISAPEAGLIHEDSFTKVVEVSAKEEAKEVAPKEKKERKKTVKSEESKDKVEEKPQPAESQSDVVEEKKETPKKSQKIAAYNSSIPEHKSILGGFLTSTYKEAWKTVRPAEEIKAFTTSLNGKDFIDESGMIVPSFSILLEGFFGA